MSTTSSTDETLRREVRRLMQSATGGTSVHGRVVGGAGSADLERGLVQLGVAGALLPESVGGGGASIADVVGALQECGRTLVAPHLVTDVLVAACLSAVGCLEPLVGLVDALVEGTERWTLAWPGVIGESASVVLDDGTVDGRLPLVVGGASADRIVLVVPDAVGASVVLIDRADVVVGTSASLDLSRDVAEIVLPGCPVRTVGVLSATEVDLLRATVLVAVAADSLGGIDACLDEAVAYAKERTAFGRPIGSFQAVRHRCAEMFVRAETTRASVDVAARDLADRADDALASAMATASHAVGSYAAVADAALLVHGGLGFTFEFDSHFFVRRAYANTALLGTPEHLRSELVDLVV